MQIRKITKQSQTLRRRACNAQMGVQLCVFRRTMKIETERLVLREMTPDDYDAFYAVLADSEIMEHYPYTFDESKVQNWKWYKDKQ